MLERDLGGEPCAPKISISANLKPDRYYFLRRRRRVPSEFPGTNAFCRTAPSDRRRARFQKIC
jgi:hypothetical protein